VIASGKPPRRITCEGAVVELIHLLELTSESPIPPTQSFHGGSPCMLGLLPLPPQRQHSSKVQERCSQPPALTVISQLYLSNGSFISLSTTTRWHRAARILSKSSLLSRTTVHRGHEDEVAQGLPRLSCHPSARVQQRQCESPNPHVQRWHVRDNFSASLSLLSGFLYLLTLSWCVFATDEDT
jgi:hypothetical protein